MHCIAVCSGSVCVVERGDSLWVHTIWSRNCFSSTAVAALAVNTVQTRFPFLTACQFHIHHRQRKLQMGSCDFLHFCPQRDTRPSFTNVTMTPLQCFRIYPSSLCLVPRSARFDTPSVFVILTLPSSVSLRTHSVGVAM